MTEVAQTGGLGATALLRAAPRPAVPRPVALVPGPWAGVHNLSRL